MATVLSQVQARASALEQLLEVRADCIADDPQGAPLIEAYLDWIHGLTWREQDSGRHSSDDAPTKRASAVMTREEAFAVLGLPPTASDAGFARPITA